MSQSDPASFGGRDRRYVVTTGVVERPVAERPTKDSPDAIAEWLVGAARAIPTGLQAFDGFAWRMLATGLPLLRVTLHSTLHPQFLGTTFVWWRTSGRSEQTLIAHEITDVIHYEDNPVQRVCIGGETLRRRLDGAGAPLDFAVLTELKARGATDYLALPIRSIHGRNSNLAQRPVRGCWPSTSGGEPERNSQLCCGPRTCVGSPSVRTGCPAIR
jgi:adenylate cyclase